MRELMRHVLCLLVLMLCCTYGCVSVSAAPQPSNEDQAAGHGIGSSGINPASGSTASDRPGFVGAKITAEKQGSHNNRVPLPLCPEGTEVATTGGTTVSGVVIPTCIPRGPVKVIQHYDGEPVNTSETENKDTPGVIIVDNTTRYPGTPHSRDTATGVVGDHVTHPNTIDSCNGDHDSCVVGGPGTPAGKTSGFTDLEQHQKVQGGGGVKQQTQSFPAEQFNPHPDLNKQEEISTVTKIPCTGNDPSCNVPGIPGGVATPPPTSSGSQPGVGVPAPHVVPGFPGVHPNVTHTDTAVNQFPAVPPHVNVTVGTPTVALNRRSGPNPPPPTPVVSESSEEVSGPTNTHHEENDNQAETTAAPSQSAPTRNTPNTPTKVTPPAMPTILQPPMPAKSETKPPKKRKADSSSISSVWVRVPLLIVAVLFSITVY
ncbi:uncharacterized protein TM35_000531200 [Trypanosoma theileri]|uniref:Mucin-associated surface protein (MASP) n=1 Tax=Trypanosoma theileri TaxID=67003 RepID=A0A1X0NGW4_9TRYP|nr:uncharacterized protein TM35_000531200 [Trypanosoma theileri]ORC83936.1 hypothetical protein TM35_000531200 [Trypanosoma theileri]